MKKPLLERLLEFLRSRDDIQILGPHKADGRVPTISILPLNKSLEEVYATLTNIN